MTNSEDALRIPCGEPTSARFVVVRSPRQCLEAVLANLEMVRDVARARIATAGSHCNELLMAREVYSFQQAITLIRLECASILEDKP